MSKEVDEVRSGPCPPVRQCGADKCRYLMWLTAFMALVAAALALTGGIMELCGAGDANTNGGLATAGGSIAVIAFIVGAATAWQCVGCKFCSLAPRNNCS